MTEEFNLSDKQSVREIDMFSCENIYLEEDVKEFIKLLKERLNKAKPEDVIYEFDEIINKLAGDNLI